MPLARLRVRSVWAALTALVMILAGMGIVLLPAEPAHAATSAPATSAPATSPPATKAPETKAPATSAPGTKAPEAARAAAGAVSMTCEPGTVYSVSSSGQMRKVTKNSGVAVGDSATKQERYWTIFGWRYRDVPVTSFNGLGIGKIGSPNYAYERTDSAQTVEIYQFDTSSGTWSTTGAERTDSSIQFIGGAVDLDSSLYYFGGFTSSGSRFNVYVYNSGSKSISFKGSVDTSMGSGGRANGDMAFDSQGNLFVVRGSSNTTTVFSVTKADLAAGAGGEIKASPSGTYTTNTDVNGVAFDASGRAYLGTGSTIKTYDMPDWSNSADFASGAWSSSDLASCSSPATIALRKDVSGGRAKASDQFTLSLKQGSTDLGTATTTGSATGLQKEIVGPQPAKRGATIKFSEAGAAGANLDDYASKYSCTVDDTPISGASGEGTSGTVTIPNLGEAVVCTITNSPLTANVSIHKDVADEDGKNVKPGKDWTVGAKATATTGGITQAPTAATQKTNSSGDAKWALKFDKTTGRATIAVSETQQDGFEFASGSCGVTHLDGTKDTKKLDNEKSTNLTGIKPGDAVDCTYLNKVEDTSLTLVKKVDNKDAAGTAKDTDWTLKAVGDKATGDKTVAGKTGTKAVTDVRVKAGDYKLSELDGPEGYEASDWDCGPKNTVKTDSVTLKAGDSVTCTITNTAKTGNVTWKKTDEGGSALKGSVWTMTGPDGTAVEVEDCTAASADKCTGPDKDPAEGKFAVSGLKWGDYALVEKSAPAGYILDDTPHTFTVSGSDDELRQSIGSFTNEQKPPVALPLTGGTGSQIFIVGGAALLTAGGVGALLKGLRRRNRKN
ncbi:SpaA isopeptide-forming pilin-related protein [Brevibacterium sp. CBA3109]|uniref:SpaA isopeptide-forming pilin-related protein n=1 Tax=Brevibacterium koreense TaxID=3140787 RepID=A0AAU7UK39_9MICO